LWAKAARKESDDFPKKVPTPALTIVAEGGKADIVDLCAASDPACSSVLSLTHDSQIGANLRGCADAKMRRGVFRSVAGLKTAIREYLENHNTDPKPFIWTKSAGEILEKVARAKQALESQH